MHHLTPAIAWRRYLSTLVLGAVLVAGCGDDDSSDASSASVGTEEAADSGDGAASTTSLAADDPAEAGDAGESGAGEPEAGAVEAGTPSCQQAFDAAAALGVTEPSLSADDTISADYLQPGASVLDRGFTCSMTRPDFTLVTIVVAHYADPGVYDEDTALLSADAPTYDVPGADAAWYRDDGGFRFVAVVRADSTHYGLVSEGPAPDLADAFGALAALAAADLEPMPPVRAAAPTPTTAPS